MNQEFHYAKAYVEKTLPEEGTLEVAIANEETKDRMGETISVNGWELKNFKKNPLLLWSHNAGFGEARPPIGRVEKIWVEGKQLRFIPKFDLQDSFAAEIYRKYKDKFLNAFSVGLIPLERDSEDTNLITRQELLEISAVNVPAHPAALVELRSMGFQVSKDWSEWEGKEMKVEEKPENQEQDNKPKDEQAEKKPEEENKPEEQKPTEEKPVEQKPIDEKPVEEKPIEENKPDEKPNDNQENSGAEKKPEEEMIESAIDIIFGKPYPNEHACRLKDPGYFDSDSFRRMRRMHKGKAYSVIMGKMHGETTMTEQAYRYPKKGWTADEAKDHCQDHKGHFEAAAEASFEYLSDKVISLEGEIRALRNDFFKKQQEPTTKLFNDRDLIDSLKILDKGIEIALKKAKELQRGGDNNV